MLNEPPRTKTISIVGIAVCVMLTVCDDTPVPLTVIDAVRCDEPVLAEVVMVTAPFPVPDAGETVSHVAEPLLTVQLILEVIVSVFGES